MSSFMKSLRESHGGTQEQIAKIMGVSRPTYIAIESGKQPLNVIQAQKLARHYHMKVADLIEERMTPQAQVTLEEGSDDTEGEQPSVRISVPQKRVEKFKEVLLYILEEIGARPNVGKAVLCKLLYFIDFDYYEKYEEQLMGAVYIKNHYGPTPPEFPTIVKEMEKNKDIKTVSVEFHDLPQRKYIPLRNADLSLLNAREKDLIDKNIERFKNFTARQMETYSHKDVPWITAEDQKPIDYESVFYRTPEFSQRNYDEV